MTVRATADRRFRRVAVKPAHKRGACRSGGWVLVRYAVASLLVVYACYRASNIVLRSSTLQVSRIAVTGNRRLSTGEVLALVSGLRGENIIMVHLDRWRRRLLSSPWVGDAALRRVLPSTIEVVIFERTPIGVGRFGSQLYLVDTRGTIIDEYGPRYSDLELPIIDGLQAALREGEHAIDETRASLATRLLEDLKTRKDLARRVSQIDVADPQDAIVILSGDSALVHLGGERFLERLQAYVDLAPALRARVPEIDYVDLRFDDRVYVRPASGAGRGGPDNAVKTEMTRKPT